MRVVGPPYYSLLRAVDRNGSTSAPRARFSERSPGVWTEVGWSHPLSEHLKPFPGKLLLIGAPREWTWLDDGPFRDVYEVMDFALPARPSAWTETPPQAKIRTSLTLQPAGSEDAAELWVMRDNAVRALDDFVGNSSDDALHRLAFAAVHDGNGFLIVLRVRPSPLPPPELMLHAEAYKSYLRMPNLFLPLGRSLQPPLRRDTVRKLLADDPAKVVWLVPLAGGLFRPESLPEDAFRPLEDWVDYVLDHEQESLRAWVQATQFDFEGFVCREEIPDETRRPSLKPARVGKKRSGGPPAIAVTPESPKFEVADEATGDQIRQEDTTEAIQPIITEPDAPGRRLLELEEMFTGLHGGLDAPERRQMWPQLANLNSAIGGPQEAAICWRQALWLNDVASEEWAWTWFCAEAAAVPARSEVGQANISWASRVSAATLKGRDVVANEIDTLLALNEPGAADVRALAAYLFWALLRETPSAIQGRLDRLHWFLEKHEYMLTTRAAWLTWTRLARGDVLALARARDRLLERLYQGENWPLEELPAFLRFVGRAGGADPQSLGKWLSEMAERAQLWIGNQGPGWTTQVCTPRTREYSDLLFAYGLARLGERDACLRLRDRASRVLGDEDVAHFMLLQGFTFRIQQALDGKASGGPLPPQMLDDLEKLRAERKIQKENNPEAPDYAYMVERMRELSRVFEPHQQVDPYRHLTAVAGPLDAALAELPDMADKSKAVDCVYRLLKGTLKGDRGRKDRNRIVRAGLDAAPRLGEEFALAMLDEAVALADGQAGISDPNLLVEQIAPLLGKSLFVTAHFDSAQHIPPLVSGFRALLKAQQGAAELRGLDAVASYCFRGLRKLGLREEVNELLQQTADAILGGRDLNNAESLRDANGGATYSFTAFCRGGLA